MINAAVMFHLSRILGREYVQQKFRVRSQELDRMKDNSSFLGVFAWRINPLVPFRLMDLGFGLTKISFRKYFIVIFGISFFRILWLQFIIAGIGVNLLKDIGAMQEYFYSNPKIIYYSVVYFLAVIVVTIAAIVARSLKKRKAKKHATAK